MVAIPHLLPCPFPHAPHPEHLPRRSGLSPSGSLSYNRAVDAIIIEDLAGLYHVGVPDEERAKPQRLLVSLTIDCDFSRAAQLDDIAATIDYFAVSQRVLGLSKGRSWKLIEKLASDIASMVILDFKALAVTVEIKKFIIAEARYVAVRIERSSGTNSGELPQLAQLV